jgi:aldose 1-epimerase
MHVERCGWTVDGAEVFRIRLCSNRLQVDILTLGASILRLYTPDARGALANVVLAHGALEAYRENVPYFGSIVGRYANRIAGGRFELAGKTVQLAQNNGANALHGGVRGFSRQPWKIVDVADPTRVHLRHVSRDGEENYPGALVVDVTYNLTDDALRIDYRAETDAETIVNLTNHSYFNLSGESSQGILDHELTIHADAFTPVDPGLIPTGELRSVDATPFDFRRSTAIGARLRDRDIQLKFGRGYDHNWVLRLEAMIDAQHAAVLRDPTTGRIMEVYTTEPGLQVYTGNMLDGTTRGPDGGAHGAFAGVALETQHFPDSPHHAHFPSTRLSPDAIYQTTTYYRFPRVE